MYNLPQEIEVWYIIPALRKELAMLLVKKHNLTMKNAGNILGVSKSAISHYINKKRATHTKFPLAVKKEIEKSTRIIAKNKNLGPREIFRLLNIIKKTKSGCRVCKKYNKEMTKICKIEPICK